MAPIFIDSPKNQVIKPLPVDDNTIFCWKTCDYQSHPYFMWKSSKVVRITLVQNVSVTPTRTWSSSFVYTWKE